MISVVIPSYNRRDCILALLADVCRQEGPEFEIIVVDDCSPDNTVEAIRRDFPRVTVLVNEVNGGPAVTRNRGIRAAKGEIVVGFDSDVTVPDTRFLIQVEEAFRENPGAHGLAFRILKPDGVTEDTPRWWHPVPIGQFADRSFLTSYFSGTGYAFRKDAVIAAGLFPEILYMHYEEVELAFRILDNGGTILHTPHLKVLHHANEVSRRSQIRIFYKPRNQVLVTLRCYPFFKGLSYIVPRLAYGGVSAVLERRFLGWLRAMGSAIALTPNSLRARRALAPATWRSIKQLRGTKQLSPPGSPL